MMKPYFNVMLEFDRQNVDSLIYSSVMEKTKGYICAIESNNLTIANMNPDFLEVLNNAMVNICDGSVLARLLGIIHKKNFKSYIGDDLMINFITNSRLNHYFLGNTREVLDGLRVNLGKINPLILNMTFESLPFMSVEEFNYTGIAESINKNKPDIIWISLGAPKQEFFMSYLLPFLDQGVLCAVGAAFNFNAGVGPVKRAPRIMRRLYLEWLYRAIEEPRKNIPRYAKFIRILPKLIYDELKRKRNEKM
jgi:N-acetylglucosaminyldiphosphoundecaprenol N-acetyl-beta-D-mannosaminyltransferase